MISFHEIMAMKLYIFNPRHFYKLTRKKNRPGIPFRADFHVSVILKLVWTKPNVIVFYFCTIER